MRVRKQLLTRSLCVGLSFLMAATPVPAVAQDALPPIGEVAQPVATIRSAAVELAPPLPIDSVGFAAAESQSSPANPGDRTQGPPSSDAAAVRGAAEVDARRDVGRTKWILIGVAAGTFVPSMLAVHLVHPNPPATRFIGKTPEYTAFYVETWKNRSHARRVKYAWIGVGIFFAVAGGIVAVACGTGGGCAPAY